MMSVLCAVAERHAVPVGLYGSTPETLSALRAALLKTYPALRISFTMSPPFRALTATEQADVFRQMREADVRLLFVALGCPKQERWMLEHREQVDCVMVGVGAAFEMLSGRVPAAPVWAQRAGLEWAYRLSREPRRLWRRYAKHNVRFVVLIGRQILRERYLARR